MVILSFLIFCFFITASILGIPFNLDEPLIVTILVFWITFAVISLVYSVNGILLDHIFQQQLVRQQSIGKPLEGIRGYDEFRESMLRARNFSILVTLGSIISLLIFIIAVVNDIPINDTNANVQNVKLFLTSFALTFAFITISLLFLIEYPEDLSFNPGGLIGFYEPDEYPMLIDNLMFDVFKAYLDPVTFLDIEEWSSYLFSLLDDTFEPDEKPRIRLEQAQERILLLLYLHYSNESLITDEILMKELTEIVGEANLDQIIEGIETGLTLWEIQGIIKRIDKLSPEPFRLVDRLLVSLSDDYDIFINKDLYFTVSAKTNQGSVRESTGIVVYFLNNTTEKDRSVKVELRGGRGMIQPDYQQITTHLDPLTDPYPEDRPNLIDPDKEDILGILTDILNVGDAIWFRVNPNGFGYKIVTIQAQSNDNQVFARTFEMKFTKGVRYYAKNYLPKLSGLASIALPLIQGFLGFRFG